MGLEDRFDLFEAVEQAGVELVFMNRATILATVAARPLAVNAFFCVSGSMWTRRYFGFLHTSTYTPLRPISLPRSLVSLAKNFASPSSLIFFSWSDVSVEIVSTTTSFLYFS